MEPHPIKAALQRNQNCCRGPGTRPRACQSGDHGYHGHMKRDADCRIDWLMGQTAGVAARQDHRATGGRFYHWVHNPDFMHKRQGKSIAFPPRSISSAFALAYVGAGGDMRDELTGTSGGKAPPGLYHNTPLLLVQQLHALA